MSLDTLGQSGKDIPLPSDIQHRLDNARNNVTLLEAESTRLKKLIAEQTTTIQNIHQQEVAAKTNISKLQKELDETVNLVAARRADLVTTEAELTAAKKTLLSVNADRDAAAKDITNKQAALDKRQREIELGEENLAERQKALFESEAAHSVKVEKLKAALG